MPATETLLSDTHSAFGVWLKTHMEACGLNQATLAKATGLAQSTISTYLKTGRAPRTREKLNRIVRALTAPGATESHARLMLDSALRAIAGDVVYDADSDFKVVAEAYDGGPANRTVLVGVAQGLLAKAAQDAARAGAIGRRDESDDQDDYDAQ